MRPYRVLELALVFWPGCVSDSFSPVDLATQAQPAECVAPTGAGTIHGGSVSQAESWTAADSPHFLPYDTEITATLALEPCAVVLIGGRRTITVAAGGRIQARGTAQQPIVIAAKNPDAPWASIRALTGGTISLAYTSVLGGGDPLNANPDYAGAIDIRADQGQEPTETLHADHLLIQDSASQGIYLHQSGGFSAASTHLVIEGSKGYPIHASANLAGTIPSGVYIRNGIDEILLAGSNASETISRWDVTLADHGVPYHIGTSSAGGRLDVGGYSSRTATLTIDPGVTLRFKRGGALYVDYSHGSAPATGALIAAGTSDRPILFTSAEPEARAGDWLGLNFGDLPSPLNRLEFVVVAYAGGVSNSGSASCPYPGVTINDAAIRIYGPPPEGFITNTTIFESASNGIDRGWASDLQPDFLTDESNQFMGFAGCSQTVPRDGRNDCPIPVPCPK